MKVVRRLSILALAIIVAAMGAAGFLVWRSLPDYDAVFDDAWISGEVEIVRTDAAVPHIFAATDPGVFFGLGYSHAQDRLWQMEVFRRTAQGRLSEMLGEATLPVDELLRRFDLYGAAEASLDVQDPYTTAALEAYSAGINARLRQVDGWGLGRRNSFSSR